MPEKWHGLAGVEARYWQALPGSGDYKVGVYTLPKRLQLTTLNARLTELREDQAKYIGVAKEGPYKPDSYRY